MMNDVCRLFMESILCAHYVSHFLGAKTSSLLLFAILSTLLQFSRYMLPGEPGTTVTMILTVLVDYITCHIVYREDPQTELFLLSQYHLLLRTTQAISICVTVIISKGEYQTGNLSDNSAWELTAKVLYMLLLSVIVFIITRSRKLSLLSYPHTSRLIRSAPVTVLTLISAVFPMGQIEVGGSELALLLSSAIMALYFLLLLIWQYSRSLYNHFRQLEMEHMYDMQKKYYSDAITAQQNAAKMAHDLRKHTTALTSAINGGDLDKARGYLRELDNRYQDILPVHITGNPDVDAIINAQMEYVRDGNVTIKVRGMLPEKMNISSVDISILVGNALDNAIEATDKLPGAQLIDIHFWYQPGRFQMKIENPCRRGDDGGEGLGLKIIRQTVELYGGTMRITTSPGRFTLTTLLWERH